jgi:hypothetical protein
VLSENIAKHEAAVADRESFDKSRDSREELQHRYGAQGDLATTIDQYIAWAKAFKENPQEAGQHFAAAYMVASPYSLKPRERKEKAEAFEVNGKRYNGKVLDEVIDNAQRSGEEKKDFQATAAQREALKEIFPNKTFDEALATIVRIDREAYIEPMETAARLATAFGLPVLPHQQQAHAEMKHAEAMVDRATQRLPGFEQLTPAIASVLNNPQFQRTGDHAQDLQRAYSVAVQQHQEHLWTAKQLGEIEKTDPAFARAVADVILKDAAFEKHVRSMGQDLVARFHSAVAWTRAKTQSNQRAVSKASRVKPVRSSGGALGETLGKGGLDSTIANALKDY